METSAVASSCVGFEPVGAWKSLMHLGRGSVAYLGVESAVKLGLSGILASCISSCCGASKATEVVVARLLEADVENFTRSRHR